MQSPASLTVAILAPFLGAFADNIGPRKPWVALFSVFYVVGAASLWFITPADPEPWLLLLGFAIGLIGVEFATVFTNAMLPDLGSKEEVGRISGSGWALGYVGGTIALLVVLAFLVPLPGTDRTLAQIPPILGTEGFVGERATGPLTALWYLIFMIPFFLWTGDVGRKN